MARELLTLAQRQVLRREAWKEGDVDAWWVRSFHWEFMGESIDAFPINHPMLPDEVIVFDAGVYFPVGGGLGVTLSPGQAVALASELCMRCEELNGDRAPWSWWFLDHWGPHDTELNREDVQEVIELLCLASDHVLFGPEEWAVEKPVE